MTNKLISALALFVFLYSSTGYAQIEELEPTIELETENPDAATTVADHTPDFDDTWRTPFVSDEMTRDPEQNKSWRLGEYKYNAKPKSSLEFGLHGGHYFIDGDVDRLIPGGWGAGFHLRRSINYTFSLRGSALYSVAYGQESQPWYHENVDWGNEPGGGLVGPIFDAYDPTTGSPDHWFPNHKTTTIAGDLAVVVNLGNLLFHRERNKWNWYASIGAGLSNYKAELDLLNGAEPYSGLIEDVQFTWDRYNTKAGRDQIESDLRNLYDGIYETEGEKKVGIFRINDDINIHVVFVPSMGISRKISKRLNLSLEHQIYLSDNDYLDGIKYRTEFDQTNNVDIGHYTSFRIGVNIGNFDKVTEPLYWMNGYDSAFGDIAELKSKPSIDLTDNDNDGVLDIIDQQLDTPEDCAVDTRGILLDSDGDGIADCQDREPYSRPGYSVNSYGVADYTDECCRDEENINKLIDSRTSDIRKAITDNGTHKLQSSTVTNPDGTSYEESKLVPNPDYVGRNTGAGSSSSSTSTGSTSSSTSTTGGTRYVSSSCGDWFLPMIHFDLNKSSIKPEYYSHLHNVAQVLKKCPSVCVVAKGHTDSRNSNDYNNVLSYKRAKTAVDHLVDNYDIDRGRILLMYGGEDNPMVRSPFSESHHFMNRRVEFTTCSGTDYDMAAPEGYNNVNSGTTSRKSEYYQGNKTSGY